VLAEDPDLLVGAGTVIRSAQVEAALEAGARFIVSPGFSRAVVAECRQAGVPVFPGVATATEIQAALEADVEVVKFFPAEASGGVPALKALAAPFGSVRFVPTGGITVQTLPRYLSLPAVLAVGGSWIVAPELLATGNFGRVTELAAAAVEVVRDVRAGVGP
jgi:2-dehydro-3-deoxyphosphogluconate aldolase/(4S)-4-hydroxy-2-oxoglutarate aldolase